MISPPSHEYFQKLQELPPLGACGFDRDELRQGMAVRREPTFAAVQCLPAQIDDLPCQCVLAKNVDPDIRLRFQVA